MRLDPDGIAHAREIRSRGHAGIRSGAVFERVNGAGMQPREMLPDHAIGDRRAPADLGIEVRAILGATDRRIDVVAQ